MRLMTPPPQQKPTAPTLPVEFGMVLEERHRGGGATRGLVGLEIGEHIARLVLVGWRAAIGRQHVGGEGEKAFEREPPRDVLDVRVEAAVLVDDEHCRALGAPFEPRQIAADLHAARVIQGGADGEPRVVGRDDRRLGVVVL